MKRNVLLASFLSVLCASVVLAQPTPTPTPAPAPVVKVQPATPPIVIVPTPAATPAATPATQPAALPTVPGVPQTVAEAVESAKQGIDFAKAKNWWGLSSIAIFILMFILNATKLFDKIGKRWAYIILPVLGVGAMLLAKFAGGLSWGAAIAVLTSAPSMGLLWDFFKRGILAQETTTPMKPVA